MTTSKTKTNTRFAKKDRYWWVDWVVLLGVCLLAIWLVLTVWDANNFSKKWEIFYRSFFEKNGYRQFLEGLKNTAIIACVGLVIGIVIGTLIAVVKVIPPYKRVTRYFPKACEVYVAFFRGTPMMVQLLVGYYILFPMLKMKLPAVDVCVVIFGLNSGAYISEIMRGGIQSVDGGQMEAGRALGLSFSTTMLKIVVPQAVKNILPTLGNEFIALIKETAIVGYVGAVDICRSFQLTGDGTYEYMMPYLVMAVLYIVIVLVISSLIKLMERRFAKSDRKHS